MSWAALRGAGLSVVLIASIWAPAASATEGTMYRDPVTSRGGVIASVTPQAAEAAIAILDAGGNAADAAAAAVFAVGVTRPDLCGIGGGGFIAVRMADGRVGTLDYRETAPAAMQADAFQGEGIYTGFTGHKTIGVPGTVAGMAALLDRFGTKSLADVIVDAERLAREGFPVSAELSSSMAANAARLRLFPESASIYLVGGVTPYPPGQTLIQADYATSLKLIQEQGPSAFYKGDIADLIVKDMEDNAGQYPGDDGLMTLDDIAAYKAKWRKPLTTRYRHNKVIAVPPPTSGGLLMIEILNILRDINIPKFGFGSANHLHYFAEAQKIAWADRDTYVGDPDFVDVPIGLLSSKTYAAKRRKEIKRGQAGSYPPADTGGEIPRPGPDRSGAHHTTHVSVVDAHGNAVSITCTIEFLFGSAVVAPGAGFLLNNQLTDFSAPGTANEPQGGKRPRSSTTPAIVVRKGQPVVVAGGAGGPRIPMGVILTASNVMDFKMDIAHAVDAERINEPACCDLYMEDTRVAPEVQVELENRGHTIVREGEYNTPVVQIAGTNLKNGKHLAVSDPRGEDGAGGQGQKGSEAPATATTIGIVLLAALLRRQRRSLNAF